MLSYDQCLHFLENSPTIRLLRSDYAALALSFFYEAFRKPQRLTIPIGELETGLSFFLENLQSQLLSSKASESTLAFLDRSPSHFINLWCSPNSRFLRKYFEQERDEPVTELTSDTERALEWMESLQKKQFVGTESRFLMILKGLKEIVAEAQTDPKIKIKELQKQKKEIERKIEEMRVGDRVGGLNTTQIKERFFNLVEESRRLLSDFRLVEENFKEITDLIKGTKLKEFSTKGEILGNVLDANDSLEQSDQGRSFYAFWRFMMAPIGQNEMSELINQVFRLEEIKKTLPALPDGYSTPLKKLKGNLIGVGQKTLHSVHRLSEEMKKLLHTKNLLENKKVAKILEEIRVMALQARDVMPHKKKFVEIEQGVAFHLPLERPLWVPKIPVKISRSRPELGENSVKMDDWASLQGLVDQVSVDKKKLKENIRTLLKKEREVTLGHVLTQFPPEKGMAEVLAYFQLAVEMGGGGGGSGGAKAAFSSEKEEGCLIWPYRKGPVGQEGQEGPFKKMLVKFPCIIFYH